MVITLEFINTPGLFIQEELIRELNLTSYSTIIFKYGKFEKKVPFLPHTQDKKDVILVSTNLLPQINIPTNIPYELIVKDNEIQIGPVLGILLPGTKEKLAEKNLSLFKNYLIQYQQLRGLIILFTLDGVNTYDNTVDGYAYHPDVDDWEHGTYILPTAIFTRRNIDLDTHKHLYSIFQNNFFNSYTFNKWELWEWMSQNEKVRSILPYTSFFSNEEDLKLFLQESDSIFIKPIWGMKGSRIYQIQKTDSGYLLHYRIQNQNIRETYSDLSYLYSNLKTHLGKKKYILQQAIPFLELNQQKLDIRVVIQKNRYGYWEVQGMITRIGEKESIVSNISSGGRAEKTWDTFLQLFDGDERAAYLKWKDLEQLALFIVEELDQLDFHFSHLGLDIGIDQDYNFWLIEINNRDPDPTIALDAEDRFMYYKIKTNPLFYAKWVSGFKEVTL